MRRLIYAITIAVAWSHAVEAQSLANWTAGVADQYRVVSGITYLTASNWEAKLDIYTPRADGPHPTVLHIHGGGWVGGSKDELSGYFKILAMEGLSVVGVDYSRAPQHRYPTPLRQISFMDGPPVRPVTGAVPRRRPGRSRRSGG